MITRLFHAWEHRLVNVTTDRVVRPFEWGLDWIGHHTSSETPYESIREWSQQALEHPDTFFSVDEIDDYKLQDQILTFPSPFQTPHPENNKVYGRYFPSLKNDGKRRAVVVLPQWNADSNGHLGLSKLIEDMDYAKDADLWITEFNTNFIPLFVHHIFVLNLLITAHWLKLNH